jgi:hypothetical protein
MMTISLSKERKERERKEWDKKRKKIRSRRGQYCRKFEN